MSILYGQLQMPEKIKLEETSASSTYCRFVAEPLERGAGHTLGNSLRRTLLTSIESPAIVSLFIEGVPHEYMAIDGIIEDMTNIILNFKGALLRNLPDSETSDKSQKIITKTLTISDEDLEANQGQKVVTLGDLVDASNFEVVNPDLHLFTVTKPFTKRINLRIGFGKGYVSSERHKVEALITDEILIDSAFSPVRMVNYFVEDTRIGQDTDYDRLILEVTTDGRITPEEALSFSSQILIKNVSVFTDIQQHSLVFEKECDESDSDHDELMKKLAQKINEIELSVRSTNCLSGANIMTIGELVIQPESEMLKFRNFGKKSLNEIKSKLTDMNLSLGMDLSKYGITIANVKEKMQQYHAEDQQNAAE